MKYELDETSINNTRADNYVPEVEQNICLIKEWAYVRRSQITFKVLPPRMITELINLRMMWISDLPTKNGVSSIYIPQFLVMVIGI